ncbi:MAG: type II toxin-antitoxin system Phd/YefM family antitoxin [Gemmatimonadota bacterium]
MRTRPTEPPGDRHKMDSVPSTEAQNNFGRVMGRVAREGELYITKHNRPQAVLLSIDKYLELVGPAAMVELDPLSQRFDQMLAEMQTDRAAAGADRLFSMTPEELSKASKEGGFEDGE